MNLTPSGLLGQLARVGAATQNAMEIARFGGLGTAETTPFEIVAEPGIAKLRRYASGSDASADRGAPVVLIPPLMMTAEVWDVSPTTSAVRRIAEAGHDPWVIDFGSPEDEEGGLARTLTDHVLAVSEAIDIVIKTTGRDVHLGGYSQGGMFAYQAAALRQSDGIKSLITFGSPVDAHKIIPFGLPEEATARWLASVTGTLFKSSALPGWMTRVGFKLLDPVKTVRARVDFLRQLHDRELIMAREPQRRFLDGEGFIAWPGPALAEFFEQYIAHNRMLSGGFVVEGRLATLADITCPVLAFVGEVDQIAPPPTVRALEQAAPRAEGYEVSLPAGHFGLVVGSRATEITWPNVAAWVTWQEGGGEQPDTMIPLVLDHADDGAATDANAMSLAYALELASNVGIGTAKSVGRTATASLRAARAFAGEALDTLPRLARLERVDQDTRISLGLVLDEQAQRSPDDTFFLYEGRAHTYAQAKGRIDAVVRGLISVGVRQGEHVGVLMGTRPTALATVAALSRIGAVVVLLRPDGDLVRELELGGVRRVIVDPEHAAIAAGATSLPILALGGVGADGPRKLAGVVDLEQVDPDAVDLPGWYVPNPGRAQDLAFILFAGGGDAIRLNRITNRRWSLSAFGTASAAALEATDTVYAVTPIHHPSGLLNSIGGAVAGGSRIALATSFSPATFWSEVRRYGVTVVPYTWTLCRELVLAEEDPNERHHPVRLFMGSGMPVALWRAVTDRFAPAQVLEFYASTQGRAVLGNLRGRKVGAKGRPLPGSAEVRIARWDPQSQQLIEGRRGFAQECRVDEVGMLLARADRQRTGGLGDPLRGVFERGDAWLVTGDLFRKDADGDYWLVERATGLVPTATGPVPTVPTEDALGRLDEIVLAVVYGLPDEDAEVLVAGVQERRGETVTAARLTAAVEDLSPAARPVEIHLIDEIPTTTWFRPRKEPLRAAGMPTEGRRWVWDGAAREYVDA